MEHNLFFKCHDLIAQLKKANQENRLHDMIKHFNKYKLLSLDEIGYLPINKEDTKLLFQLIDKCYFFTLTIFISLNLIKYLRKFLCENIKTNKYL